MSEISDEEIVDFVEKEGYSTTDDLNEAIWLLRDGQMISGGVVQGRGVRILDHTIVEGINDAVYSDEDFYERIHDDTGMVRIVPEAEMALIKAGQLITDEQRQTIRGFNFEVQEYTPLNNEKTQKLDLRAARDRNKVKYLVDGMVENFGLMEGESFRRKLNKAEAKLVKSTNTALEARGVKIAKEPEELRSLNIPGYVSYTFAPKEEFTIISFPLNDEDLKEYAGCEIKPINSKDGLHFNEDVPLDIMAFNQFVKDNESLVQKHLDSDVSHKFFTNTLNRKIERSLPELTNIKLPSVEPIRATNRSR